MAARVQRTFARWQHLRIIARWQHEFRGQSPDGSTNTEDIHQMAALAVRFFIHEASTKLMVPEIPPPAVRLRNATRNVRIAGDNQVRREEILLVLRQESLDELDTVRRTTILPLRVQTTENNNRPFLIYMVKSVLLRNNVRMCDVGLIKHIFIY